MVATRGAWLHYIQQQIRRLVIRWVQEQHLTGGHIAPCTLTWPALCRPYYVFWCVILFLSNGSCSAWRGSWHSTSFPSVVTPERHELHSCWFVRDALYLAGVLMWEVYTGGDMPYGRSRNPEVVELVCHMKRRLEQPRACSDAVYDIMYSCWHEVRCLRISSVLCIQCDRILLLPNYSGFCFSFAVTRGATDIWWTTCKPENHARRE